MTVKPVKHSARPDLAAVPARRRSFWAPVRDNPLVSIMVSVLLVLVGVIYGEQQRRIADVEAAQAVMQDGVIRVQYGVNQTIANQNDWHDQDLRWRIAVMAQFKDVGERVDNLVLTLARGQP